MGLQTCYRCVLIYNNTGVSTTGRKQVVSNGSHAASRVGQLKTNSGELVLRFNNDNEGAAVLSELKARKTEVQQVLGQFKLELTDIRRGSVVIKFHLPQATGTFDTLAQRRTIQGLSYNLLHNESFKRFRQDQPTLRIEFHAKAKLEHVTGKIHSRFCCSWLA